MLNDKIIISSVMLLLVISIPSVYSQGFDEETCLSLISVDKVKEITKFDGTLNANVINSNLESLNEGVSSGCAIAFQNEDTSFSLSLVMTASDSERVAQSIYGELYSASNQMGVEVVQGNNGPWIHHVVEMNSNGISSFVASIKDNIQVGLSAPQTDIQIETSSMLEILTIVQSGIDKLDIPKESSPNDSQPTTIEPVEIPDEPKIVELEPSDEQISDASNSDRMVTEDPKEENGGGCLIATATYGSELAPQVQQLRELRDNQLLSTQSGTSFMSTFNDVYYSFSPIIADYERENPVFKEMVKVAITPMITTLSLMEYAETESEVLTIGISLMILNGMMYVGIPASVIVIVRKF